MAGESGAKVGGLNGYLAFYMKNVNIIVELKIC